MGGEVKEQTKEDYRDVLEERGDVAQFSRSGKADREGYEEDVKGDDCEGSYFKVLEVTFRLIGAVWLRERVVLVESKNLK